jgi:KaiC/GvpD/RAD55 family RecA-like ATPase
MVEAGTGATSLVVTGEPDVGKTSLTLRVAEHLQWEQDAAVTTLSLRDLPARVVDVEQRLGASIPDVLAATAVQHVRLVVVDGAEAVLEGRQDLLREVATAAIRAGVDIVAVTRTDGSTRVREVLRNAAGDCTDPSPRSRPAGRR